MSNAMTGRNWLPVLLCVTGVTVAFLTRHSYLHCGYLLDDYGFVAAGPLRLKDVPRIFSPTEIDWFYRPVFVVYARAMTSIFGGASLPRHAASLLLFGLNAGVVGWFAARISGRAWAGWLALALFATASGMDEAIWWFSSASTLLASLFSFLAMLAWHSWRKGGWKAGGIFACACIALAMCSKEDVAALPVMMAVLDWILTPKASLKTRLTRLAPLGVWACVWLVLDLLAYRQVSSHVTTARLWHPNLLARLELDGSFCYRTLALSLVGSGPPVNWPAWILALGGAAVVGWRIRRHRLLIGLAVCAVLAALPVPLAAGEHVLSARFAFFPQAWASVLGAVLIVQALSSCHRLTAMTGVAVAGQCLLCRFQRPSVDPFLIWAALIFLTLLTLYLAVRVSHWRREFLIAAVATSGAFVGALLSGLSAGLVWGIVFVTCGLFARRDWLDGGIGGVALLAAAPWTLPIFLLAPLLSNPLFLPHRCR